MTVSKRISLIKILEASNCCFDEQPLKSLSQREAYFIAYLSKIIFLVSIKVLVFN